MVAHLNMQLNFTNQAKYCRSWLGVVRGSRAELGTSSQVVHLIDLRINIHSLHLNSPRNTLATLQSNLGNCTENVTNWRNLKNYTCLGGAVEWTGPSNHSCIGWNISGRKQHEGTTMIWLNFTSSHALLLPARIFFCIIILAETISDLLQQFEKSMTERMKYLLWEHWGNHKYQPSEVPEEVQLIYIA